MTHPLCRQRQHTKPACSPFLPCHAMLPALTSITLAITADTSLCVHSALASWCTTSRRSASLEDSLPGGLGSSVSKATISDKHSSASSSRALAEMPILSSSDSSFFFRCGSVRWSQHVELCIMEDLQDKGEEGERVK